MRRNSIFIGIFFTAILCLPQFISAQSYTIPFREEGIASWYGEEFNGRPTASGEIFDSNRFTAAHPMLSFGTFLIVTNKLNNRQVTVTINDRGPFVPGRIIDLSKAAAEHLDMVNAGTVPVIIETMATTYFRPPEPPPPPPPPPPQPIYAPEPPAPVEPEYSHPPISVITVYPSAPPLQQDDSLPAASVLPYEPPPYETPFPPSQMAPPLGAPPPMPSYITPPLATDFPPPQAPVYKYLPSNEPLPPPIGYNEYSQSQVPVYEYFPPNEPLPPPIGYNEYSQPQVPVYEYFPPNEPLPPPIGYNEYSPLPPPVSTNESSPLPPPSISGFKLTPNITPSPDKRYKLQIGSYKVPRNAVEAFDKLKKAGLNPSYEQNGEHYRVVLAGISGIEVQSVADKLANAGFREAIIREDK